MELTTSVACVTLVIRADTAVWLLLSVAMTLAILVFPAWIKQCQFLVVRVHLVLQATGKTAQVTTIRSSLTTLLTLKFKWKVGENQSGKFLNVRMLPNYMCNNNFLILFEKSLPDPCP